MAGAFTDTVSPSGYILDVEACESSLAAVTSAVFEVRRPDGSETTWSASIVSLSATAARLLHEFVSGDLSIPGEYSVYAILTLPLGEIRTPARPFNVKARFDSTVRF